MVLPAYVPKGRRSIAKLLVSSIVKRGNEVYPSYTVGGAPVNGTSGTLAGIAEPGALLLRTDSPAVFQNTNTKASPTWTVFSLTSGSGTFTGTFNGIVGGVTPAAGTFTTLTTSGLGILATATIDTGTKTGTAAAGAVTLNKAAGKVTSEALVTAAAATYTLTITNSAIAAADQVFASLANGTNSQGQLALERVTPAAGSVVIVVRNTHSSQALNGTIVVSFMSLKN